MPSAQEIKVLIIGAGLSGLALAQCIRAHRLRKPSSRLKFELYERDTSTAARAQGWTLSLMECLPGLATNLPPDMPPLEPAVSVTRPVCLYSQGRMFDEAGKPSMTAGGVAPGEAGYFLRAERAALRTWLGHGLSVHWGKAFARYEQDPTTGGVRVFFEDGSSAAGDVLVAADGASSRVRAQLLGAEASKQSMPPVALVIGDVQLDAAQTARQLQLSSAWWLYNASPPKPKLFVGARELRINEATGEVEGGYFCWFLMWPDLDVPKLGSGHWLQNASAEAQIQHSKELVQTLPAELREIVELSKAEGIVLPSVQFKEFAPPETLPEGRVTILGDAAHAMTPFRGQGANTAFLGVWDLANALFKLDEGKTGTVEAALKEYEAEMIPRGRKNLVAASSSFTKDAKVYAKEMAGRYGAEGEPGKDS